MARTVAQVQNDISLAQARVQSLQTELTAAKLAEEARPKAGSIFQYRVKSTYGHREYSKNFYLAVDRDTAYKLHNMGRSIRQDVPPTMVYGVALEGGTSFGFDTSQYDLGLVAGRL